MKIRKIISSIAILISMAAIYPGCTSLQDLFSSPTSQSAVMQESVASAEVALTAANSAFAALVQSNVLTLDQALAVSGGLDKASDYLGQAKAALAKGDDAAAQAALTSVNSTLATSKIQLQAAAQAVKKGK